MHERGGRENDRGAVKPAQQRNPSCLNQYVEVFLDETDMGSIGLLMLFVEAKWNARPRHHIYQAACAE